MLEAVSLMGADISETQNLLQDYEPPNFLRLQINKDLGTLSHH